ncbi:MAG: isochorismatase family protein [Gemmataceae bacterium]
MLFASVAPAVPFQPYNIGMTLSIHTTEIDFATTALLVVDVQQGFSELCPAELPVPGALGIVPVINRWLEQPFARIDATQDWHPPRHCSFLGERDNLYPPHCVAGTPGAEFLPGLATHHFHAIWRKGYRPDFEAYAVTAQHPGFIPGLRASGIRTVLVCGIATNICCYFAARDLVQSGFAVTILTAASVGIDVPAAGLFQSSTQAEGERLGIHYA